MASILSIRSVRIDLTGACNARCTFCPYHGIHASKKPSRTARLEVSDITKLVREFIAIDHRPQFKFSGRGEATTHPRFKEIVALLAENGIAVRIITNGIATVRFVDVLRDARARVLVSIHGPREVHDHTTKVIGSYAKASMSVRALKHAGIDVAIATVITPHNLPLLASFAQAWNAEGVPLRIQHDFTAWRNETFSLADIKRHLGALPESPQVVQLPHLANKPLESYYAPALYVLDPHRCTRILEEVDIDADGTLYVCRSSPFGNIRNASLSELICGNARQAFIQEIQRETKTDRGLSPALCDRCCYQAAHLTPSL